MARRTSRPGPANWVTHGRPIVAAVTPRAVTATSIAQTPARRPRLRLGGVDAPDEVNTAPARVKSVAQVGQNTADVDTGVAHMGHGYWVLPLMWLRVVMAPPLAHATVHTFLDGSGFPGGIIPDVAGS